MHNKTVITPITSQAKGTQGAESLATHLATPSADISEVIANRADAYELLTNDVLGLNFTFNGLQTDLGLIQDPLTPRRPLKSLLMDKGALAEQAMVVENKLEQLSKGMAQLKVVHRQFAQKYKCHYVTLTSIIDRGRSAKFFDEVTQMARADRNLDQLQLEYPTLQRNYIVLHWRANKSLAHRTKGMAHEFKLGRRVHLFEPAFEVEYRVVREVFTQDAPHFYQILAAFEQIRVALNIGYKTYSLIGKDILLQMLELSGGGEAHFPMTTRRQVQVLLEAMDNNGKTQDVLNRLAGLV